ncbi:MAG: hypothetical protein KIT34_06155 [Cyanobacteria bacterium TGS_CYA1]|nr:hypothetical protein [Cyanobacteria bacterium TGS_CYA1]
MKRNRQGQQIAEFGPALMIAIPLLAIMLSCLSFGAGVGALALGAQHAAREAAATGTYTLAQQRVNENLTTLSGPLGQFGGIQNGKLLLVVEESPTGETNFTVHTRGGSIDPANKVYRYKVRGECEIKPLFWWVSIPTVYEATGIVEHPEGLGV